MRGAPKAKSIALLLFIVAALLLPTLTFEPASAQTYTVRLNGPYYDSGTTAVSQTITYRLLYYNGTQYTNTLTASPSATSATYISSTPLVQVTWNSTSVSSTYNSTRVFRFANGANDIDDSNITLHLVNPDTDEVVYPTYPYTFSITDFYGMTDPYLQSSVYYGGEYHVVEQVNLAEGGGYVTFIMQQHLLYTLTFVCAEGTYSQTFTPILLGTPGQNPVTLSIYQGNFPSSNATQYLTTNATRSDSTITVTYVDPTETTNWTQAIITHKSGSSIITDYTSSNASGHTQTWDWTLADTATTYTVTITASVNNATKTLIMIVPADANNNPWDIDWDNLGAYVPTLPVSYTGWGGIDPTQLIGAIIIMFALGIGSYFSTGASCLISWIIAGILYMLGWWQGSIPLIGLALVLTILVMIDEYKRTSGGGYNL